ncbi:MAG: pseudouridine synthase [Saprospiraceae bacterium]|jgi:23S rRNA pseudouridine2605 synthase
MDKKQPSKRKPASGFSPRKAKPPVKAKPGFKDKPEAKPKPEVFKPEEVEGMRLNKYVAHCGVCSRRQAADLVKAGKVTVNGAVVLEPFYQIKKGDKVAYDGKAIQPEERKVYILMNKPKGVITTVKDEKDRKTVLDLLKPKVKERIYPVGRLDRDTTGLLLLTNDGDLAKKLAHPSHKVQKIYHVTLERPLHLRDLEKIREGITLDDGFVQVDGIDYVQGSGKTEVGIEIHIGKNRIVRRIFESLGYTIEKLDRTYYAGLTKKDLPRGHFRFLTQREVIMLKHFALKPGKKEVE